MGAMMAARLSFFFGVGATLGVDAELDGEYGVTKDSGKGVNASDTGDTDEGAVGKSFGEGTE